MYQNSDGDKPGNVRDWFKLKGSLEEPDDPFCLCVRGVKEPNHEFLSGTVVRHGQAALGPELQSVNEAYLH